MTVFISGGAKCGKSSIAQDLAVKLSGGEGLYYVATMIPSGTEDIERVRRHLQDRAGMGFQTVECFRDIGSIANREGTFLVDNITSLMQNALFPPENNYEMDLSSAQSCVDELAWFAANVRHAVFVSDYIYSDAERYSESTESYRKCLADADRSLARLCDVVIEVCAGIPIIHKGASCL
jgi:adenosylcobinamide kinase/adenosylcobinamide-phosphate guanylyltransferase